MTGPTFGIEEEFFLADARTGELHEDGPAILRRARELVDDGIDQELRTPMIETGTAICHDAAEAIADLRSHRRAAADAAGERGAVVLATSTHPSARPLHTEFTPDDRYEHMAATFAQLAHESLVCGCHIHVEVPDRETGVAVIDRIGAWLAPLIAISANSPFWRGRDTGFTSWRSQIWGRWPTAGPTSEFGSLAAYDGQADALVASGAALDRAMLYYDARLSEKYPTVEVRVADVCLDVDDAVLIAVLVRGLITTAIRERGSPPSTATVELLRAANFVASLHGLNDRLLDPATWTLHPAITVVGRLAAHIADALDDTGDTELVRDGIDRLSRTGNGSTQQRSAWTAGGEAALLDRVTVRP